MDGITLGILLFCFEQNFFSLRITTVGHIDIGFCNGIDFVGIDRSRPCLAKIGLWRRVRGVHALPAGTTEHGIGGEIVGRRQRARHFQRNFILGRTATTHHQITAEQCENATPTRQHQRIVEQFFEETRFRWRRRRSHGLWFRLRHIIRLDRWLRLNRLLFDRQRRRRRCNNGRCGNWFNRLRRLHDFGRLNRFRRLNRLDGFCRFRRLDELWRFLRLHGHDRCSRLGGFGGLGFRAGLLLQFGQILFLEFEQFLEIRDIFLQCRRPFVGFLKRLFTGNHIFIRRLARHTGLGPARLRFRDFDAVLRLTCRLDFILDLGGDLSARLLAGQSFGDRRLGSNGRELPAIGIPVGGLGHDDFLGFRRRHRFKRRPIGNGKNLARFEAVHVAAIESALIRTQQPDQHLVQRNAFRLRRAGNLAQRVAALDLVKITV